MNQIIMFAGSFRSLVKLGLILLAFIIAFLLRPSNPTILDYQLWLMFLCAAPALILDFKEYYRDFGYASTLTLDVLALAFVVIGRLGLTIMTLFASRFTAPLVGAIVVPLEHAYVYAYLYALFGAGMALGLGVIVIHVLARKPLLLAESKTYAQVLGILGDWLKQVYSLAVSKPVVTGFILGFGFRLLLEIYWWPWHIGWDTVEYLAHLRDFMASLNPFQAYYWMGGLRNVPPLMNILLAPFAALGDDWILLKLYPPVCYGFLTAAVAYLSVRILKLQGKYLLAAVIASIFFILNLRISWDYQRQLLGSIFMVLSVTLLEANGYSRDLRRQSLPAFMLILAAMAHEVTAYLAAMLSISAIGYSLLRDRRPWKTIPYLLSSAISIALLAWYAKGVVWSNMFFEAVPAGVVSYEISSIGESLAYLIAGYGLLIPFALIGIRGSGTFYKLTIFFLLAAGLSPLIAPKTAITTWYRFLIGASPLMVPLAFKGAMALDCRYLSLYLMVLILPGLCFYAPSDGEGHAWKLVSAIREFPVSLTPSPASRMSLEDLRELSNFVENLDHDAPIIVDAGTARWVHLGFRNPRPDQLIWLWRNPTLYEVLSYMEKSNLSKAYFVTLKPEARLMLELGESLENDQLKEFQLKLLRDGIYKVYEIER